MIKKILLTAALIISGIILLNAQCTNIIYTTSGLHPDSLKHADATILYGDTLTVNVPADTTISGTTLPIDSIAFTSITGLPASLTATPNAHHWAALTSGCIYISGTPTHAEAVTQNGIYPVVINLYGYGKYNGFPVSSPLPTITKDTLKIRNNNDGILNLNVIKFDVSQNSPNPFSNTTLLKFTSPNSQLCSFSVINVIGEKVFEKTINASAGENSIEFSAANLPSGIYMYKLSNKDQTITKRMIVEGK